MGFSAIGKGNHSHMILLDTTLHVDAVTEESKLPRHKCLKGQQSKNSHPYNPPTSLFPALDNMEVVTELMARPSNNEPTKFMVQGFNEQ
jgi:hypothetical protein